jgi:dihydrofolate reductase
VLTRDQHWHAEGAIIVHDFTAALVAAKSWITAHNPQCRKIILFGGGEIYRMGLDYCQQIELTVIDISPDGGRNVALFPELEATEWSWQVEAVIAPAGGIPGYRYECWQRANPPREL